MFDVMKRRGPEPAPFLFTASAVLRERQSAGGYASYVGGASSQSPLDDAQGWSLWCLFRDAQQYPIPIELVLTDELHQVVVPYPTQPFHLIVGNAALGGDQSHSGP
jgi:hypothetical protein